MDLLTHFLSLLLRRHRCSVDSIHKFMRDSLNTTVRPTNQHEKQMEQHRFEKCALTGETDELFTFCLLKKIKQQGCNSSHNFNPFYIHTGLLSLDKTQIH